MTDQILHNCQKSSNKIWHYDRCYIFGEYLTSTKVLSGLVPFNFQKSFILHLHLHQIPFHLWELQESRHTSCSSHTVCNFTKAINTFDRSCALEGKWPRIAVLFYIEWIAWSEHYILWLYLELILTSCSGDLTLKRYNDRVGILYNDSYRYFL